MNKNRKYVVGFLVIAGSIVLGAVSFYRQEKRESSYSPVNEESLEKVMVHDKAQKALAGRLLKLEDAIEFFHLVQQLHLNNQEKKDLVAFLRQI